MNVLKVGLGYFEVEGLGKHMRYHLVWKVYVLSSCHLKPTELKVVMPLALVLSFSGN